MDVHEFHKDFLEEVKATAATEGSGSNAAFVPYTRREAKAMKKIIILLLVILLCGCSAEKPSKTLSSMQTESAETTVAEPVASEETTETAPKKAETVIEAPKEDTTAPSVDEGPEQKPVPDTTTETIAETPIAPINTETTA